MHSMHYSQSTIDLSKQEWTGSSPSKFGKGGRKHANYPRDELDKFLLGGLSGHISMLGPSKRRVE